MKMKNPDSIFPVSPPTGPVSIENAAADWVIRRQGGLTPEDETLFLEWLSADSRHAAALAEFEAAWAVVSYPSKIGQADVALRMLADRQRKRRFRRGIQILAVAGLAAAAALAFIFHPGLGSQPASSGHLAALSQAAPPTVVLRPDTRTLPDGSVVELNAGAKIKVDFTPNERAVYLLRGEALFLVAKNRTRPFIVTAGGLEVRAVGTAFSVRYEPRQVDVVVTEGRVAVGPAAASSSSMPPSQGPDSTSAANQTFLTAGNCTSVPMEPETGRSIDGGLKVRPLTPAQIASALAWRTCRIEFNRAPLSEVVGSFNRLNKVQLRIGNPSAGALRISGIFWADDPEGFVRLLESGLGVRADRTGNIIALQLR